MVRFEQDMGFQTKNILAPDPAPGSDQDRSWPDQHHGIITNWEEFERYPWPKIEEVDFYAYEYINNHLPEGMGLIVGTMVGVYTSIFPA